MPERPTVLITSAAGKVLLVQSFQASGARVVAADSSDMSASLHFADAAYLVPPLDSPRGLESFLWLCEREHVVLLVPTRDAELPFFAAHADRFIKIGAQALVSTPAAIDVCQDKRRFVEFCQSRGFPVPRTWAPQESPSRWPVFARPRIGASSVGAVRIDDEAALSGVRTSGESELVVQEFVASPEYSIDVLSDLRGLPLQAVVRRRVRVRGGEATVSLVERRPQLEALSLQLCRAIGTVGHAVVQAFDDDAEGPKFIEVNPRFGGASNLSIAAGLESPKRLLGFVSNDSSAYQPRAIRDGLRMLRYSQDILVETGQLDFPMAEDR
jgi:carbamoyl-phosphate synthase large subunit